MFTRAALTALIGYCYGVLGVMFATAAHLTIGELGIAVPVITGTVSIVTAILVNRRHDTGESYEDLVRQNEAYKRKVQALERRLSEWDHA
jgi:uncharacterized membrane protein YbaN (DUF454 family)